MRKHQDRLYRICRRLAGNDADALDATQEAMIAIVRGITRFDGRAAFTTWSYRVATNACLDELRRRGRRPDPGLPDHEHADDDYIGGRSPRDPSDLATGRIDVADALADLPDEFRAAVVLRDMAGLDYAEIAEVLELPPGTVRSRIARGRGRLADLLSPSDTGDSDGSPGNQPGLDERHTP